MKKRQILVSLALLATACSPAIQPTTNKVTPNIQAQNTHIMGITDDSDLAPPPQVNAQALVEREVIGRRENTLLFKAVPLQRQQNRQVATNSLAVMGEFHYYNHLGQLRPAGNATVALYQGRRKVGQALTDLQGKWKVNVSQPGDYQVQFSFENPRWKLNKYAWEGPKVQVSSQGSVETGSFTLEKGTKNAEAAFIHEIYNRTLALFQREQMNLGWWKHQIKTVWPGRGDYYNFNTVNLTGAQQWDVNGHEIGHAIFDQALNARSRGGSHKIDECYNAMLAFSEGFATFFSAAVNLERNAPDAHFGPYLVPRRSPIRIENTPDKVCGGSKNEWQVSNTLWDVYDTHVDGVDNMSLSLKEIFAAFSQSNKPTITSVLDAYGLLSERLPQAQQAELRAIFKQNTMEVR